MALFWLASRANLRAEFFNQFRYYGSVLGSCGDDHLCQFVIVCLPRSDDVIQIGADAIEGDSPLSTVRGCSVGHHFRLHNLRQNR